MDSDKAANLFKICIHAERDFKNENHPSLVRRALKKQHKLYWIVVNDLRKEQEKGNLRLNRIERIAFELVKTALTGRSGYTIDELYETIHQYRKSVKECCR